MPQSRDQVAAHIREIGELQRQLSRIQADMNDQLATIKEAWENRAAPLARRADALTQGVQIWSDANRDALTQHGKTKTAAFPTGEVAWRTRPPSARITGAEAVIDALLRAGLDRFVRTKNEVNKEAILNEPDAVRDIAGITISQGEDFVITPFEAELAEGS
ncbi:MAG: host-nuclease inhibitor Gam family protein [Rhodocyclaceae bacterium]